MSQLILKSDMFELHQVSGLGMFNTNWKGYKVVSVGLAEKWGVEIRLCATPVNFNGTDVDYQYYDSFVAYDLTNRSDHNIDEFISVLQAAKTFKSQVDNKLGISSN